MKALREAQRLRDDGRALNQVFITLLQSDTGDHLRELKGRPETIK